MHHLEDCSPQHFGLWFLAGCACAGLASLPRHPDSPHGDTGPLVTAQGLVWSRTNSKSSPATRRRCKKSAQTFGGLNLSYVTTVILPSCHHPQINHCLASVRGLSRRRRSQIFVADQQLDSASPGPRFLTDTFQQLFSVTH